MSIALIPEGQPSRPTLQLGAGKGQGRTFIVLGRTTECQIQDIMCSREHMKVTAAGTCEGTSSVTLTVQNTSKQSSMVQTAAGSAWEVLGPGSSAVVAVGGIVALLGTTGTNARLKYKIVDGAAAVAAAAASSSGGGGGRAAAAAGSGACSPAAKRAKKQWGGGGGWAAGLSIYLDNTSDPAVVHVDDEVIAVKDKFPKAKYHYLVMPRDRSLHHYKDLQGHANAGELLVKMLRVGSKLIASSGLPAVEFKMGFHAVPSMTHLHLHVVSQDFDSQCLKNKKHWNSFTTDFFVSFAEMRQSVLDGGVVDFSAREHRIRQDLKCHRCDAALPNMPKLKAHIATCRA